MGFVLAVALSVAGQQAVDIGKNPLQLAALFDRDWSSAPQEYLPVDPHKRIVRHLQLRAPKEGAGKGIVWYVESNHNKRQLIACRGLYEIGTDPRSDGSFVLALSLTRKYVGEQSPDAELFKPKYSWKIDTSYEPSAVFLEVPAEEGKLGRPLYLVAASACRISSDGSPIGRTGSVLSAFLGGGEIAVEDTGQIKVGDVFRMTDEPTLIWLHDMLDLTPPPGFSRRKVLIKAKKPGEKDQVY